MKRKYNKVISLVLAMIMLLSACGGGKSNDNNGSGEENVPNGAGKTKDTLVIAYWQEPNALDPQASGLQMSGIVMRQMFDGLVKLDENRKIVPALAESWELIDDTTMRFYLRDNVYFHNGDKFTAEDVKYTLLRGTTDPGSASTYQAFDAEATVVVDELTIDVKLKRPYAPILDTLATTRGLIVNKKYVEEVGPDEHSRAPMGTGAYKFVDWVAGSEIIMEKNDEYWGEKAKTPNLIYKIITESANRIIELETGSVDIVYNVLANDVSRVEDNENMVLINGPSFTYITLTMNMQDEVLDNQKLRDALAYAIDKEAITKALYGDTANVLNGLVPPLTKYYKEFEPAAYDTEKAKALLAEAGYPDGIELEFVVQPLEEFQKIAEIVQNMWAKIGVTAKITPAEVPAYLAAGNKLQIGLRSGAASEMSGVLIIYDSKFGDRLNSANDWLDERLANAMTLYDDEEANAAYAEIQDYLWEAHYSIPILIKNIMHATSDKVEGFVHVPDSYHELKDVVVYE